MSATGSDDGLEGFGYKQQLDRSIGGFASFAAGISYISILTGTFQLFYFGYGSGGPAYVWSWPLVFLGQVMVALCFAELAGRYPVAGSVYNWAKRLGSATVSWLAGWTMLTASIVTIAAVALAYQITLPQIWSGFQVYGDGTGTYDFAANAVILGGVLIAVTTVINAFGVKLMTRINSAGVFIELVAAVLLVLLLAVNATNPPSVLVETNGTGASVPGGYLGAFLVAALASGYVMYGFDTASSLGEETKDPRRTAPRAILRAINASFLLGGGILLFGILAAPDPADPALGSSTGGLQAIILAALGTDLGKAFLVCIAVAITVCCLAVQTAAIRVMFAMARDNNLPGGSVLAKVHPKYRTPVVPAVITGALAIAILLVNVRQPQIFTVVTSIAVAMIYIAYLLVTVPLLRARLRGDWPPARDGYFSLGRLGLPVNVVAVVWGAAMTVNLLWPRASVYNATEPFHWYLRWGGVIAVTAILGGGLVLYRAYQRKRTGVLEAHRLDAYGPDAYGPEPDGLAGA